MNNHYISLMQRLASRLPCAIAAFVLAACGPRLVAAQNHPAGTLQAGVSRLLEIGSTRPASVGVEGAFEGRRLIDRAGGAAAITSAMAELFRVPVGLSRVSFSIDNALGSLDHYRAFEFVAPRLYSAARMYRVTCSVFEF